MLMTSKSNCFANLATLLRCFTNSKEKNAFEFVARPWGQRQDRQPQHQGHGEVQPQTPGLTPDH